MGAISSCCKKSDYASLDGAVEGSEFSSAVKDEPHVADNYNQELSPFVGTLVELKFTSKSGYEDKFVWLNSTSRTIHMSQHTTKEKRHKEASLADVSCHSSIFNALLYLFHYVITHLTQELLFYLPRHFYSFALLDCIGNECGGWTSG